MQVIYKKSSQYFLKFKLGEEVISGLEDFVRKNKIKSAHFYAIGAASEIVLSYYDLKKKKYLDKKFKRDLEITSLVGNIAHMKDKIIIHCHGNFSDRNMKVLGGHVKNLIVSGTCEVALTAMDKKITRSYDPQTGLNLMQ